MGESTLNDSEIIAQSRTTEPDDKGRVAMQFVLPDGHIVQSGHMAPDAFAGKWWMTWTTDVRKVDEQRIMQAQAAADTARRKALEPYSAVPMETDAPVRPASNESGPTSSVELPDDPDQMIRDKVRRMLDEHNDLAKTINRHKTEYAKQSQNIDKWLAIAESLGINLTPTPTGVDKEESDETNDDGSPDGGDDSKPADSDARPAKSKRGRTKRGPRAKRSSRKSAGRGSDSSSEAVSDEV